VVVNGEKETGVSLHYMTPRPDDGDIVGQKKINISPEDTVKTLHEKAAKTAALLLDEALPQLKAGRTPRSPQDHSKAT
jgi:UDP-4-amino-4-deoxy-L-arabinose formyltransferase / UDP-glucuronic acid dehydrogenase (UDP-4-keto-hexauronic acid decarboxylating)